MAYISFENVSFTYPGGESALEDVSLNINRGENVAVIGRNGAGKTTAAKLMNGLLKPLAGSVTVNGMDTRRHTAAQMAKTVGYAFQNPGDQIFNSTVLREVSFGPRVLGMDKSRRESLVAYALELTGLEGRCEVNPYDLPLSARKLLVIACVVASDCPVIILDEPAAGQDFNGMRQLFRVLNALKEQGKTIIAITHSMEFAAEHFSRIIVVADKRVVADSSPQSLFWDGKTMAEAGLRPPLAVRICQALGAPAQAVTIDEAAASISGIMGLSSKAD